MINRMHKGGRMSQAVIHNGFVFLAGQVPDDREAGITEQTRDVLAKVENLLKQAGTDKSHLVNITVLLPHIADFASMNAVYDRWIDPNNPPARACCEARLADPDLRIEVVAIAAMPMQ